MMHENMVVSMPFIQIDVSLHAAKFMTITLFTFIHVLDLRGVSSINKDDYNSIRIMKCACTLQLRMTCRNIMQHVINDMVLLFLFWSDRLGCPEIEYRTRTPVFYMISFSFLFLVQTRQLDRYK